MDALTFRLMIDTGNDTFQPDPASEVARMLRALAARLESGEDFAYYQTLFDINGNDCGRAAFKRSGS